MSLGPSVPLGLVTEIVESTSPKASQVPAVTTRPSDESPATSVQPEASPEPVDSPASDPVSAPGAVSPGVIELACQGNLEPTQKKKKKHKKVKQVYESPLDCGIAALNLRAGSPVANGSGTPPLTPAGLAEDNLLALVASGSSVSLQ